VGEKRVRVSKREAAKPMVRRADGGSVADLTGTAEKRF
jgi:hypothetical protein